MNMIDQIIEDLADSSKSLMGPILKTKVLASRIGNQEIVDWADRESTGYRDRSDSIPAYRVGRAVYKATLQQGSVTQPDTPLPLMIFDDETRQQFFTPRIEESVSALELMAERGKDGGNMRKEYAADICQMLTTRIQNNATLKIRIRTLTMIADISEVVQVLAAIRVKLLDFMIKLEKELPLLEKALKSIGSMKEEEQEKVANLFNQIIIVNGDHNNVTSGKDLTVQ
jgi:AbiTii-like protein